MSFFVFLFCLFLAFQFFIKKDKVQEIKMGVHHLLEKVGVLFCPSFLSFFGFFAGVFFCCVICRRNYEAFYFPYLSVVLYFGNG